MTRTILLTLAAFFLTACAHCPPCPECLPEVRHDVVDKPVPIACPAIDVDQPTLLLQPASAPLPWREASQAIEHDYRELALFYTRAWPQILAQRNPPPAPTPTPPPN